jgi:hypothetical protein
LTQRSRGREWRDLTDPEAASSLRTLLESNSPRIVVVRSPSAPAGSEFLLAIVRGRSGPGVLVSTQGEVLPPASSGADRWRAAWKVLMVADDFASIAATMAAMERVRSIVLDADTEPLVPPLWLPPALLTAYSLAPPDTMPVLAVDSWDDLVASYYRDRGYAGSPPPTEDDLEEILLRSLDRGLRTHLIVVTRRLRPVLEAGATIVLEISAPERDPTGVARVRVLQGPDPPPRHDA